MKKIPVYILVLFTVNIHTALGGNKLLHQKKNTLAADTVSFWLTDPGANILFQQQQDIISAGLANNNPVIVVDDSQRYQTMEGFGFTLTGGSAYLFSTMDAIKRASLLQELFGVEGKNIGTSYLRISIGASDLDDHVFSYDDLPEGQTDKGLSHFTIDADRKYLIPVLKQILAINPSIKILGSPWSPPVWMKTNHASKGGSLLQEYYAKYADYFVRYIKAMEQEGITIDAVTLQNEPLNPDNNPSLLMLPEEQASFIKNNIGPAFKKAGIQTKIILYDHNADRPDYPLTILKNAQANSYVDGSAFHLYGGTIAALSAVHNAYPGKNIYFTEQWVGAPGNLAGDLPWHITNVVIGSALNWSRTALEWNIAADAQLKPHTPGGCTQCLGAVTIDGNTVTRNPAYYVIAHAAKFIRPGSVRIASTETGQLSNAAFITPGNKKVLLVVNNEKTQQTFTVRYNQHSFTASLQAGAVGTFTW